MDGVRSNRLLFGVIAGVMTLALSSTAVAHVVVKPTEVLSASFQTFTVSVPNEKDMPTTKVELKIPTAVQHVTPTQKSGWQIDVDTNNEDEVTGITWSGGTIDQGLRDEFTFSAQAPEKQGEVQWKAYQTYSDGTIVAWDKEDSGNGHHSDKPNEGPFSVTNVVGQTEAITSAQKADSTAAETKRTATRALSVAAIALALGVVSVVLATRKKS